MLTIAKSRRQKAEGRRQEPALILPSAHRLLSSDVTAQIGNTPLLCLSRIAEAYGVRPEVELCAKAEWFNPGGSVKDRAALYMIRDGEQRGLLTPSKTIVDATSGNTGIAYAMIGAER